MGQGSGWGGGEGSSFPSFFWRFAWTRTRRDCRTDRWPCPVGVAPPLQLAPRQLFPTHTNKEEKANTTQYKTDRSQSLVAVCFVVFCFPPYFIITASVGGLGGSSSAIHVCGKRARRFHSVCGYPSVPQNPSRLHPSHPLPLPFIVSPCASPRPPCSASPSCPKWSTGHQTASCCCCWCWCPG